MNLRENIQEGGTRKINKKGIVNQHNIRFMVGNSFMFATGI